MTIIRNQEGFDVAFIDDDNKFFLNSGLQIGEVVGNKVYSMKSVFLGELWNNLILVSKTLVFEAPHVEKLGVERTPRMPTVKGVKRIIPAGYRSIF